MTKRKSTKAAKAKAARVNKRGAPRPRGDHGKQPQSKTATLLALLARKEGASREELQSASGWQPHSLRGFLAGTVKKMPGVTLSSEKLENGARRYRVQQVTA
jgi:transglutaminase/protease-like cytokinesis protein 3